MLAFLNLLREKYGGVEKYVQDHCGLSNEDINIIRRNLLLSEGTEEKSNFS